MTGLRIKQLSNSQQIDSTVGGEIKVLTAGRCIARHSLYHCRMERNNRRIPRASDVGTASLRNAAAKFVAARFDSRSQAVIAPKSASQFAGFSTVTVSGACSAGLDRCAYTLGKWQSSVRPAQQAAARKQRDDDISSQFPSIERAIKKRTEAKQQATDISKNTDTIGAVARFENYANRTAGQSAAETNVVTASRQQAGVTSPAQMDNTGAAAIPANLINDNNYSGKERRIAGDRRDYTIKTLLHCLKNPQRSTDRRKSNNSQGRYALLDVFDGSAMFLAVALTTLSLCDAFFTLNILARGGQEVNPFMNYMLGYGTFAFVASKMFFTAVAVVVMTGASNLLLFKRIRVRSVLAILTGLYCGLIVYELLILAMA